MDWREFLTGKRARDDLFETFPPEHRSDLPPTLLSEDGPVLAARVGAKVLEIVAKRGGTRLDPSAIESLLEMLDDSLPDGARNHCDDEAGRILDWLEHGASKALDKPEAGLPPELEVMLDADVDNRASVIEYTLDSDYDLELEYFDEETTTWPVVEGTPQGIERDPKGASPTLRITRQGEELAIPVRNIRWLMPVRPEASPDDEPMREELGRVLDFPDERMRDDASDDEDGEETSASPDDTDD